MNVSDKGKYGEYIAKQLWPSLELMTEGERNRTGVDAIDDGIELQIKYDSAISRTNNIYHEIWEKTKGKPEQQWRSSPHKVDGFIFITEGFAIRISSNELALAEIGLPLIKISETSIGFLIPIKTLSNYELKRLLG